MLSDVFLYTDQRAGANGAFAHPRGFAGSRDQVGQRRHQTEKDNPAAFAHSIFRVIFLKSLFLKFLLCARSL